MSLSSPTSRRARVATAALAVTALVLAGCSDDKKPAEPDSSQSPAANGRGSGTLVQTWPLTGLKAENGLPDHPVAVVKVDNTGNARPQVGLDQADLVLEELVEGGLTRLAAFYYSRTPSQVGPVRSMRDSDIGIVKPTNGALIASGGAAKTVHRLKQAGLQMYSETNGNISLEVDSSRRAPYNRIVDLKTFAKKMTGISKEPPKPYLPFGSAGKPGGTKVRDHLTVTFSPSHQTSWAFHDGAWVRQNGEAVGPGDEFKADNLLVLSVRVGDAGYLDPAGNPVPKTIFEGTGKATLIQGRKKVTARWSKKSMSSPLTLATKGGKKVTVPSGHTWVELIPKDGGGISPG